MTTSNQTNPGNITAGAVYNLTTFYGRIAGLVVWKKVMGEDELTRYPQLTFEDDVMQLKDEQDTRESRSVDDGIVSIDNEIGKLK